MAHPGYPCQRFARPRRKRGKRGKVGSLPLPRGALGKPRRAKTRLPALTSAFSTSACVAVFPAGAIAGQETEKCTRGHQPPLAAYGAAIDSCLLYSSHSFHRHCVHHIHPIHPSEQAAPSVRHHEARAVIPRPHRLYFRPFAFAFAPPSPPIAPLQLHLGCSPSSLFIHHSRNTVSGEVSLLSWRYTSPRCCRL